MSYSTLQENETFFTIIGCMDGRVQIPRIKFGQKQFDALYPDTITEAGIVGILANNPSEAFLAGLKKKIDISLQLHHSKGIMVGGHAECAGNPVPDDVQKDNIRAAVGVVKKLIKNTVPVVGNFAKRSTTDRLTWEIEPVSETMTA